MGVYFPASGGRSDLLGSFGNLAVVGYSWPSSTYGIGSLVTRCGLFHFTSDSLASVGNGNRGAAVPVRCVQELACLLLSVFLFFTFVTRIVTSPECKVAILVSCSVICKFKQSADSCAISYKS